MELLYLLHFLSRYSLKVKYHNKKNRGGITKNTIRPKVNILTKAHQYNSQGMYCEVSLIFTTQLY